KVFRRLLAEEGAVVTGTDDLVLRDPLLEVVISVWPVAEGEDTEDPATAGPSVGDERSKLRDVESPVLDAVFQQGGTAATPEILAALAELLADADAAVRAAAARAVRHLGGAAATPMILSRLPVLLRDAHAQMRDNAGAALVSLGAA